MTPEEHRAAALALSEAEETGEHIGLLSVTYPDITLRDAYAIQKKAIAAKIIAGDPVIGWKIGATRPAMQRALHTDMPISGVLTRSMQIEHGDTIPTGRFIQPRIEAGIAFVMKAHLGGAHVTRQDVLDATDYVVPALDILDPRVLPSNPGAARTVFDTVADNAETAGIVLGLDQHSPEHLRRAGAIVSANDTVEETGLGACGLGDPVDNVVWLAQRMAVYGNAILAGQIILSGSFVRPVDCKEGTQIHADFGDLGEAAVNFA